MTPTPCHKRVLAIDLSSRGFGYAVLDAGKLADWGIRRMSTNRNAACIGGVRKLMVWYAPEILVLEDCQVAGSRRKGRIKALSDELARLAERMQVRVVLVPWTRVQRFCGGSPRATKEQIASRIGELFPEIRARIPPKRKPWMSEDERMNIFDAVGLAVAENSPKKGRRVR